MWVGKVTKQQPVFKLQGGLLYVVYCVFNLMNNLHPFPSFGHKTHPSVCNSIKGIYILFTYQTSGGGVFVEFFSPIFEGEACALEDIVPSNENKVW